MVTAYLAKSNVSAMALFILEARKGWEKQSRLSPILIMKKAMDRPEYLLQTSPGCKCDLFTSKQEQSRKPLGIRQLKPVRLRFEVPIYLRHCQRILNRPSHHVCRAPFQQTAVSVRLTT